MALHTREVAGSKPAARMHAEHQQMGILSQGRGGGRAAPPPGPYLRRNVPKPHAGEPAPCLTRSEIPQGSSEIPGLPGQAVFWRLGHKSDPAGFVPREHIVWGNRWDDPSRRFRTLYAAEHAAMRSSRCFSDTDQACGRSRRAAHSY